MKNIFQIKHCYRVDAFLTFFHIMLLILSFLLWKFYPHIQTKPDMSGLFFMIVSILGGIISLIILVISLPRLDRTIRNLALFKFILAFIYWISSTVIFILFGINKFFFNKPLVLLIFIFIFFSSIYLSIIYIADMRKKDWLILGGIFSFFALFIFLTRI